MRERASPARGCLLQNTGKKASFMYLLSEIISGEALQMSSHIIQVLTWTSKIFTWTQLPPFFYGISVIKKREENAIVWSFKSLLEMDILTSLLPPNHIPNLRKPLYSRQYSWAQGQHQWESALPAVTHTPQFCAQRKLGTARTWRWAALILLIFTVKGTRRNWLLLQQERFRVDKNNSFISKGFGISLL